MSNSSNFDNLFEGKTQLATLPDIFYQLQDTIDDPDSTFDEIGKVILTDPNLTASLLRIANSPYYAPSSKIESVSHALSILGLDEIKNLALSTLVIDKFKGMSNKIISMPSFWERSLCCAFSSKIFGEGIKNFDSEKIFIGGLLHNIGLLYLCIKIPEKMEEIVTYCMEEKIFLHNAEKIILGFDHALVGEHLLKVWKLPSIYQEIAKYHYHPFRATQFRMETSIVHFAAFYTRSYCIGGTVEIFPPDLDDSALESTGFNRSELDALFQKNVIPKFRKSMGSFLRVA